MKLKILRYLDVAVEYSVYGLVFFIPISIAMTGTFAGLAVTFFLFKKILSPDFTSIKSNKALFLFLLLFFIFMGLSLFNSGPLLVKSLKALFFKWGRYLLIFWMIADTFQDTGRIFRAMCVLLFSATLVGLSVFSQKFFGWEFLRARPLSYSVVTGPFKNQNGLAAYLTCIVPIVLSLSLWKWKRAIVKAVCLSVLTVLTISLLWTISRGGWTGLVAGGVFIIVIAFVRRIKKLILILFLASLLFYVPLLTRVLSVFKPVINNERSILSHGAWSMIIEHPFLGKGIGTFMDYCAFYTHNFGTYYAHNCFLQIWAESGVFSLFFFILSIGYAIFKCVKVILRTPESPAFFILIGLSAGLLGFSVHSFFDTQLYSFQLSFLFWVVLGLMVALSSKLNQEQPG